MLQPPTLSRFRAKMQHPAAWAIRILEITAELAPADQTSGWRSALEFSLPAQRRSLFYYVQVLQGNGPEGTVVPELPGLSAPARGRLLEDLRESDLSVDDYYSRHPAFRKELTELTDRYLRLGSAADPLSDGMLLLKDTRAARERWKQEDERLELVDLENKVLGHLALVCKQQSAYGEALKWYEEAAKLTGEHGLEERWLETQVSRAEIHQRGGRGAAEALRSILPLWEEQRATSTHLPGAELTLLLAETYSAAGDRYEARKYAGLARRQLGELGLERDPNTPLPVMVDHWVDLLAPRHEVQEDFLGKLMKTLLLNLQLTRLEARLNGQDEEVCTKEYATVIEELWEAVREQETEDHAAMEAFLTGTAFSRAPVDADTQANGPPAAVLYWEAGEAAAERGDWSAAHAHFEAAYTLGQRADDDDTMLHSLSLLMLNRPAEDVAGRFATAMRAIRHVEGVRSTLRSPYQRSAYLADKEMYYTVAMISAWKLGNTDELLRIGELLKGEPLAYRGSLQNRRRTHRELHEISDRLASAPVPPPEWLEDRQRLFDRFMLDLPPSPDRLEKMPTAFAKQVRSRISPDAAVLSYYNLADQVLLVVALTRERECIVRQVEQSAGHFDQLSRGEGFGDGDLPLPRSPRYVPGTQVREYSPVDRSALTAWLLPPEIREMVAGKESIYVCPHRQLHQVPFHALRVGDEYLVERHLISYIPNLHGFLEERPLWQVGAIGVVACADYTQRPAVDLPRIPGTEREADRIVTDYREAGFRADPLLGSHCHRDQLVQLLDGYEAEPYTLPSVLHLAVHGEAAPGDTPLDTRLFLHRGVADGFDLLLRDLPFPLVVLSSCFAGTRPGAGRDLPYLPADDLFGFQASFFAAGAHRVLGALWAVDDDAGAEIMMEFHRQLLRGEAPVAALALSQRRYLATTVGERRDPRYWAPFFVVEGRSVDGPPSAD
ncbi:CHAT domain-containing protein [Lewinella sp. JB7]|uniref:CHAT domain-containing protein n=1 Tax=Lewinella sp. JB7 TaxID=2962887 RepID=UPI0020C9A0AB|nr:CHAT domain-containing protein [Lewinella sp. JB7]MCP9234624.1 CHAT domain-containing protein [Lewinella sp. JB7]